jgi:hypothetical protein
MAGSLGHHHSGVARRIRPAGHSLAMRSLRDASYGREYPTSARVMTARSTTRCMLPEASTMLPLPT